MIFNKALANRDGLAVDDLARRRTWAELVDRSTRVARLFRDELKLPPEAHVAVLMENRVEYVELALGAIMAGVWLTPVNRHLQADEIAYIVADSGCRVLFTDARNEAVAERLQVGTTVCAGRELDAALTSASDNPMPLDGPAGGMMIYTSGTTGRPKGVKRARAASLGEALARQATAGRALGLDGSGPHLVTGPLYHAAPLLFAIYDQANGAPIVLMPKWDAAEALHLIREREIRHTHMVPTMFVRLLRLPEEVRRNLTPSPLQLVLHGAAPIAPATKQGMIDWWGPVLVEYWGATEGGVCTLVDSADWLGNRGTVGKPIANFEVFAVGDHGRRLAPGETGTLYCRHKHLDDVFEYHGDPAKTAEAYLEPGVFTTGDIGQVDADGYVYLLDRKSAMIISGGVNIYPAEVEQVLQEHPAVSDVAVFGIPDDEWGESVKAAVQLTRESPASSSLEADILAFARRRLARYKVPRSIDFEEELPRHPTGKLLTRLLRDRYWKGRERNI